MRDKQFDLLHTQVELPIFAYLSRRPFLSHIMGSDLRELAFSNSLRGILLRRSYRRSKAVLYGGPGPHSLLSKLKLKNTLFLPMLHDISFFKPQTVENKFNTLITSPLELGRYEVQRSDTITTLNHKLHKILTKYHEGSNIYK